jgi:hypothetical protein
MTSFKDLLAKAESYFLPRTAAERTAPSYDGIYDPCGDSEIISPSQRGSMMKDKNGKLYYPTSDGYQRTRTVVNYYSGATALTTTGDTAVTSAPINISTTGGTSTVGRRYYSAYQNSGGPLTLSMYADAGKTQLIYSKAVATATPTVLTEILGQDFGTVYFAWSAAAGATQYIIYCELYAAPINATS